MQTRSVHDNRVIAYEVDGERQRIVLHTRFDEHQPPEHTDVVFEGVLAYRLEDDNFGNILFGVEEVPLAQLVSDNAALFEDGRKYAWPGSWNDSLESSLAYFASKAARAFEISSSYGLRGWVVAETCQFEAASPERAA